MTYEAVCDWCGREFTTERRHHGNLCDRCDAIETAEMRDAYAHDPIEARRYSRIAMKERLGISQGSRDE